MNGPWVVRLVRLMLAVSLAVGAYLVFVYQQDIIDRWRLINYAPSAEIVALADATTMHGRGRDLFYVSDPKVNERDEFNLNCTDNSEESLVLGCYALQKIYVYNVTDERLKGVKEVTAAHEMLHAAYERLSDDERGRVNSLIEAQLTNINDTRLNELVALYDKYEPGQRLNELHSILGTEFGNLSNELETYYSQYFTNRARVVTLANAYEAVFTESQDRIAHYDQQLADLKKQIDANSAELDARIATLNTQGDQLDSLRTSNPAAYNSAVPVYNASVRTYNNLATRTRELVSQYNGLVQARNGEVAAQNDLYHSLDSNYQTVSTD